MDVVAVAKIVVGGSAGAGTTTFVRAASEIVPLDGDRPRDHGRGPGDGPTTTGFDFGRVTLAGSLALQLFGLPSSPRCRPLWDAITAGCSGVVLLVDGRQLPDGEAVPVHASPLLARARGLGVPLVVAVNQGRGRPAGPAGPFEPTGASRPGGGLDVPTVRCDAANPESARACLAILAGALRHRLTADARCTPAPGAPAGSVRWAA